MGIRYICPMGPYEVKGTEKVTINVTVLSHDKYLYIVLIQDLACKFTQFFVCVIQDVLVQDNSLLSIGAHF